MADSKASNTVEGPKTDDKNKMIDPVAALPPPPHNQPDPADFFLQSQFPQNLHLENLILKHSYTPFPDTLFR